MAVSVVIITGMSGAGMSSALKVFEDLGYFAVDNLPVQLIPTFVRLCDESMEINRTAFVVDVRSRDLVNLFPQIHQELLAKDVDVTVVFLEADTDVLLRRYSETRRPHPLPEGTVSAATEQEREMLAEIRTLADVIIDTSEHTVHTLRDVIKERFAEKGQAKDLSVTIASFGFRHGIPRSSDMIFDVRFLPNPHFIPELRAYTGRDAPVIEYLENESEVEEAIYRFVDLLAYLLPRYQREGKSYLTIGIGCTGGRHRSVMIAEALHKQLNARGYKTRVMHRDIDKDQQRYKA
ncbi:MAG: RNase adapter RapZ [Acidobacteriota bacterium]